MFLSWRIELVQRSVCPRPEGIFPAWAAQESQSWPCFSRAMHPIICTDVRLWLLIVPVPSSGEHARDPSPCREARAGVGVCRVSPWQSCVNAALQGRSLQRFLLQYCSHQHKLPDAVEAEV